MRSCLLDRVNRRAHFLNGKLHSSDNTWLSATDLMGFSKKSSIISLVFILVCYIIQKLQFRQFGTHLSISLIWNCYLLFLQLRPPFSKNIQTHIKMAVLRIFEFIRNLPPWLWSRTPSLYKNWLSLGNRNGYIFIWLRLQQSFSWGWPWYLT